VRRPQAEAEPVSGDLGFAEPPIVPSDSAMRLIQKGQSAKEKATPFERDGAASSDPLCAPIFPNTT
jgi:hypothetical protein